MGYDPNSKWNKIYENTIVLSFASKYISWVAAHYLLYLQKSLALNQRHFNIKENLWNSLVFGRIAHTFV